MKKLFLNIALILTCVVPTQAFAKCQWEEIPFYIIPAGYTNGGNGTYHQTGSFQYGAPDCTTWPTEKYGDTYRVVYSVVKCEDVNPNDMFPYAKTMYSSAQEKVCE